MRESVPKELMRLEKSILRLVVNRRKSKSRT